jgi:hypothetical protein
MDAKINKINEDIPSNKGQLPCKVTEWLFDVASSAIFGPQFNWFKPHNVFCNH